jgi:hypothetical protein
MRRTYAYVLLVITSLFFAVSCRQSTEPAKKQAISDSEAVPKLKSALRFHWVGKKNLTNQTNAANFMRLWGLPESQTLEDQTLGKLAAFPWRKKVLVGDTSTHPTNILRSLIKDLIENEAYFEFRWDTNRVGESALAVRLETSDWERWRTNLATVLQSLGATNSGVSETEQGGWHLQSDEHSAPQLFVDFSREGKWTLVALGTKERSLLAKELGDRLKNDGGSMISQGTNSWIEGDGELGQLYKAFNFHWPRPMWLSNFTFSVTGDGTNVRTHAEFYHADTLPFTLEPWKIPTNTIREPLVNFTAVQGIQDFLGKLEMFSFAQTNRATQAFEWGLSSMPFNEFIALKIENPTNAISGLGPRISEWLNARIPTNCGTVLVTNSSVIWTNLMAFANPYISPLSDAGENYLLAGVLPVSTVEKPAPIELLSQVTDRTNLVFYQWEFTQEKLKQLRFLEDTTYIFFSPSHRPPFRGDMVTMKWFQNCATNLNNAVSELTFINGHTLRFTRKSQVGLTSFELDLLARWLESPVFPEFGFLSSWNANSTNTGTSASR